MAERGPVEGWIILRGDSVYVVKGCFHPLPRLFVVPRRGSCTPLREACLGYRAVCTVDARGSRLLDPVDVFARLRSVCSHTSCPRIVVAALELCEELASAGALVGITGSIAYSGDGRDIDLVVYGQRGCEVAYRRLLELRMEGVAQPLEGELALAEAKQHGWSGLLELHKLIARQRLLYGVYKGYVYTIRMVPCLSPARCTPMKARRFRGYVLIEDVVSGFTTPAYYVARILSGELAGLRVTALTYRLRLTELPRGTILEVEGYLETSCAGLRLSLDGGYARFIELVGYGVEECRNDVSMSVLAPVNECYTIGERESYSCRA